MTDGDPKGGTGALTPGAITALLEAIAAAPFLEPEGTGPAPLLPGASVGRYEIVRELGRGAFGVLHEARDRELGRSVALKLVRPGRSGVGEAQLAREAEAIARLSHPNLVTLHDIGQSEHGPYLVFELLHGETLQERLDRGPVPVREAVRLALEVARGLAYAHAEGVVHRDLKPSNVFVTAKGQVKLLDFGMAHAFGRKRVSGGTPAYMAPEQWEGDPEDERTDVFALGVMLYRMLSGEHPFPEQEGKWSSGPAEAPRLLVAGAPDLEELVSRMLSKAPKGRPRDGGEVLAALERIAGSLPAGEPAGSLAVRPLRRKTTLADLWAELLRRRVLGGLVVGIGLAAALPGVGWYAWKRGREAAAPAPAASGPSIAVLPFADLSPNHDQDYFSDGVAEEILNALTQVQGLKVIGRTSSFSFKGKRDDLRAIGQRLGVAAVLEGSVRKAGNRVRITAQLVDVGDGYHRWSQSFDRDLTDIFAVQEEIARSVVDALKVRLLPGRGLGAVARRATNPEAYVQYLLGKQLFSRQSLGPAIAAYAKALQLDPQYAPAHAALAYAVVHFEEFDEAFARAGPHHEEALAAAEKSVALARDQPEGYAARGMVRAVGRHDWDGALADLEHGVALNPGNADARRLRGLILASLGRLSEAIAATREATELDPLSSIAWNNLGWLYNATGELGLAREALQRSLALQPQQAFAHFNLGNASLLQGRPAGALEDFERSTSEPLRLLGTALAQHDLGHRMESQQALDTLIAKFGTSASYRIARVYAWRGEADRAFEWLERAYARRTMRLLDVKFDPLLRKLRVDPRYAELLRRMNLPIH